jgi:hypothetical protein
MCASCSTRPLCEGGSRDWHLSVLATPLFLCSYLTRASEHNQANYFRGNHGVECKCTTTCCTRQHLVQQTTTRLIRYCEHYKCIVSKALQYNILIVNITITEWYPRKLVLWLHREALPVHAFVLTYSKLVTQFKSSLQRCITIH